MRMLTLPSNEFPLPPAAALAALLMPMLLVSGAVTPAIHAEVFRNVCAAMPQAEVVCIDGAGHGMAREPLSSVPAMRHRRHEVAGRVVRSRS